MRMAVFEVGPVPSAAASSCEGGCSVIPAGCFVHHQSTVRPIQEHGFATDRLRLHYGTWKKHLFVEARNRRSPRPPDRQNSHLSA